MKSPIGFAARIIGLVASAAINAVHPVVGAAVAAAPTAPVGGPTPAPTFVDVAGVGPLTYEDYMHAAKACESESLWWIDSPKPEYWTGLADRLAMAAITAEK